MVKVDVTQAGNPLNEQLLSQYGVRGSRLFSRPRRERAPGLSWSIIFRGPVLENGD
jgi:hypothetical protein